MVHRTTIVLPPRIKELATSRAAERGISFSEFVRRAVEKAVAESTHAGHQGADPLLADRAVFRGPAPGDISARHDDYLYNSQED